MESLAQQASRKTNRLWHAVCRREIEVLIATGATAAKVEANNTSIKHIKRAGRAQPRSTAAPLA